jgi:hypothetical protein
MLAAGKFFATEAEEILKIIVASAKTAKSNE